jgi:hypothetical protein
MTSIKVAELLAFMPRQKVLHIVNAISLARKKRQEDIKYARKRASQMQRQ